MTEDPRAKWSDAAREDEVASAIFQPRSREIHGHPPCPAPELVQASRVGVLPAPLQERIAAHVERCTMCQALSQALDDSSDGGLTPEEHTRIVEQVRNAIRGRRSFFANRVWQLAVAAAGVAIVALGSIRIWQSKHTVAVPAARAVAQWSRPRAVPPVSQLQKPPIPVPAATNGVARGPQTTQAEEQARALESYRRNDFAEAARGLRAVVRRDPKNGVAYFYLGVSELFLSHDTGAIAALEQAERFSAGDPYFGRAAAWYLALAYRRAGQIEEAKRRLTALCSAQSNWAARACPALREMITFSGVVSGPGGTPLAGVRVGEHAVRLGPDFNVAFPTDVAATTDANGHYSLSGVTTQVIRASHPGYFTAVRVITTVTHDSAIDFTLEPWAFISLGAVVRGTLKSDTGCADPGEKLQCLQFALIAAADGTLDASLATPTPGSDWDLHVETPEGDAFGPPVGASFPLRLAIPVKRGSTYQIRVLSYSEGAREFELTTRLR